MTPKEPESAFFVLAAFLLGVGGLTSSCSHRPVQPETVSSTDSEVSRIDISYELRHSHRRFSAREKNNRITGQTYLDQQLVMEGVIDPGQYRTFFQKTFEFLEKAQRTPAETGTPCRSRFTITVVQRDTTQTFKGCRDHSGNETTLNRLVKEGEFLLYSKK